MPKYRVSRVVVEDYMAYIEVNSEKEAGTLMEDLKEDDWSLVCSEETLRELCGEVDDAEV